MAGLRALPLAAALAALPALSAEPAGPAQPISLSHTVHDNEAPHGFTTTHGNEGRGPVAGIPSMARCLGCHKFVKEDREHPDLDKELKALAPLLKEGKPLEWVRVHRLPDHVYFTHERHVRNGVRCQECHGPVEQMEVVRQVAQLTRGWCLECHHRKQREQAGRARLTDCVTCHK